jgi:RNA polymerase sigma factor (sigma-70 family)
VKSNGDGNSRRAFDEQISAMAPAIRYFLRKKYELNDEQAKDLAHDVIVAAIEAVRKPDFELKPGVMLTTFVHSIAKHKALDFFKGQRHRRHKSIEGDEKIEKIPDNPPAAFAEIDILKLQKMIRRLGEPQSRILYLIFYKGYKVADVAEEMNMPAAQISSLKFAALAKLREWCNEDGLFLAVTAALMLWNLWRMIHGL